MLNYYNIILYNSITKEVKLNVKEYYTKLLHYQRLRTGNKKTQMILFEKKSQTNKFIFMNNRVFIFYINQIN